MQSPPTAQEEVKLSPEQEFAALIKKAGAGDADAQFRTGTMFETGNGVSKDATKAAEWYQKAATQGHGKAQNNLGSLYEEGKGVTKDEAKAVEWFQKAAEQGIDGAQFNLGSMYINGRGVPKDQIKAAEWFQKAAAQGIAEAQYYLGEMYANGEGVAKDALIAVGWFRKAAEQGNPNAQFKLAHAYADGEGVPKDESETFKWYKRAAEQGHARAQNNLGRAYYIGEGTQQDYVLAYAWFNLAASKLNVDAGKKNRDATALSLSKADLMEAQRLSSAWSPGSSIDREYVKLVEPGPKASSDVLGKQGTGTVFVVGKNGSAITNHHVVQGCVELRIEGQEGAAKVVTDDKVNDLALLQISGDIKVTAPISDAPSKLRQGEEIVVFGFPLNSLLSSGGNLTPGVVSALTGMGNNTNQFQITAPIQPGSSGSPVLNKKGEVVGVISMKLDDAKMAKATGQIGQNVNFAVSGQTLRTFLDTHKVSYTSGSGFFSREKSAADLGDEARKWTLVLECWK